MSTRMLCKHENWSDEDSLIMRTVVGNIHIASKSDQEHILLSGQLGPLGDLPLEVPRTPCPQAGRCSSHRRCDHVCDSTIARWVCTQLLPWSPLRPGIHI